MRVAMLGAKAVPAIGGVAHYVEEVGARLARRGYEVTVYCRPHFLGDERGDYRGMRRVVTAGVRGKYLDALTHTATATLHALASDYDIVHIHGAAPSVFSGLLQLRPNAHIVTTLHGLDWTGSKWGGLASNLMRAAAHFGTHTSDEIVAVSRWVADQSLLHLNREAVFIPTGVTPLDPVPAEEMLELGIEPGAYVFCASRLVREKGVHHLLEAWREVQAPLQLVIAGDCPYRDRYVHQLHSLADDRVIFAGYVKGRLLQELFSNARLYVQPSENEGLPIAVLEALSYGRCVLASDIPQNREALGPCGFTFRNKQPDDLARCLQELTDAPATLDEQYQKARDYVRRERSWELTTDRHEELYERLLLGKRRLRLISQTA